MLDAFGDRQQELLRLLLKHKEGLTIDHLREELGITNTAIRQHLAALERDGFVVKGGLKRTKGRPSRIYKLSELSHDLLPSQFRWLLELILATRREEQGSSALSRWLERLADSAVARWGQPPASQEVRERAEETVRILNELAYDAEVIAPDTSDGPTAIAVNHCVFYWIARQFPEFCRFDERFISRLTGTRVIHQECIAMGGSTCRFMLKQEG